MDLPPSWILASTERQRKERKSAPNERLHTCKFQPRWSVQSRMAADQTITSRFDIIAVLVVRDMLRAWCSKGRLTFQTTVIGKVSRRCCGREKVERDAKARKACICARHSFSTVRTNFQSGVDDLLVGILNRHLSSEHYAISTKPRLRPASS
jgi:hypothetical protein